jgi:hypothetical protein
MERTRFVEHRGRQVLLIDFTHLEPKGALDAIAESRAFIERLPADGTLLTCTDVTGATYDSAVVDALKKFSSGNRPYVRAAAVVVDSSLKRSLLSLVALLTQRKFHPSATREAALDWLVEQ